MPPINVFIAYVDTYVGKQLLQQFQHKPNLFSVYGCTWEEKNVEPLTVQSLAEQQAAITNISGGESQAGSSARKAEGSASHLAHTASSNSSFRSSDAPPMLSAEVSQSVPIEEHDAVSATSPMAMGASHGTAPPTHLSIQIMAQFFWRGDSVSMRRALASCDWIIIEQRQSQEVLDMLHYVQECTFERPKRLVLLSSFMTWYSTPPLVDPSADAEAAEEEVEMDLDDEEAEEEDINAPYPPPPEEPELPASDEDEDDMGEDGMDADEEVLTEDQYNRRIPHVKYYNWRDAEKAVAAAHHAKGLPLDTFVLFSGLPYGEGEEALEPFFRQAWSGASTQPGLEPETNGTLPIYGDGKQCVPMIHVRDLAFFTRRLLRCPSSELPQMRYVFATDGARLSWRKIIETINKGFGNRCKLVNVPATEFPLHSNVEQFTVNLRVERGTMEMLMEREDDLNPEEGRTRGPIIHKDSNGNALVAEGGFRRNIEKISLEFRTHRKVTPLRVSILGPPMSGKKYLAEHLGKHYKLPSFSIDDAIEAYKERLQFLRKEFQSYKEELVEGEKTRRAAIKKRRLIFSRRRLPDEEDEERGDEEEEMEEDADAMPVAPEVPPSQQQQQPVVPPIVLREESDDDIEERNEAEFALTPDEIKEAEELMEEVFEASPKTAKLRDEIESMERVLLMRVRPRAPTPDANPKRRANQPKKKLTKEQQRKKEEEELQQAKEAMRDAPFQDKALAIMLRWRLDEPDCRNQGYLLHGFPRTVEQAQLTFGSVQLPIPQTEEEALNPPPPSTDAAEPAPGVVMEENDAGDEVPRRVAEPSDEKHLPDHVLVLEADENYLLDRLAAVAELRRVDVDPVASPLDGEVDHTELTPTVPPSSSGLPNALMKDSCSTDGIDEKELAVFHEHLTTFKQEFIEARYSLLSYWECATTDPDEVTVGGRTVTTSIVTVSDKEPLVPPPPPASQFELPDLSKTEAEVRGILGPTHNFGPTPLEIHQEEVRVKSLERERMQAAKREEQRIRELEAEAFRKEHEKREETNAELLEVKKADLAALEQRKEPLREYLMSHVIPLLSKGLIEVCAHRPEKPVDFLSEWLLRHNPHDDVFSDL